MRHTVQMVEQAPVNNALLNVVTPMGLSFEKNRLSIGENIGKAYGIIRYPQKVDVEWLSKLTNIPSTLVSIGFKPVDNGTLINAISRSVVQQRGLADGAKDPLSRQRAEKAAEDGEKIIMQIDREGETVGLMSVEVMPVAREEKEFKKACRRAESVASVMKCKMRAIPNLQKEAFMHLSPTFPNHAKMESILQKVVPFSTFVGGFPFASSGFNDGEGYYFAKDRNGGLVIVDTWKRGGDRTNSNFCVMGNSGVGKSSILNAIEPGFSLQVADVSEKLGRGRHTTRHVELYRLSCGGSVIDTPGFSSFEETELGLALKEHLPETFIEFRPYLEQCRFVGCSHTREKGCGVLEAVKQGKIPKSRHESYLRLYEELKELRSWNQKDNK